MQQSDAAQLSLINILNADRRAAGSQRRKIAKRYVAGETMAELALEYEVGEVTIWGALQAA
ncbi:hypothetical protein ACFFWD_40705 [Bradyrhizobium erythrophlei]|uniref:hypothetical protein n=1 Tax=Bradyrhizobium erythrophlei TaxID=1437360 RepID=UPI0035E75ED4